MIVMHPHEIFRLENLVQLTRKIVVDAQIATEIAAREFGEVNAVVKNRPEHAVSKAAIVFLVILSGEIDRDVGDVLINSLLCCDRAMRGNPPTPAKPNTRSLPKGGINGNFKSTSARACTSFRKGNSI